VITQNFSAETVNSADTGRIHFLVHAYPKRSVLFILGIFDEGDNGIAHSGAHLEGGFIRKGDGYHFTRVLVLVEQGGIPSYQGSGFTAARASRYDHVFIVEQNRRALLFR